MTCSALGCMQLKHYPFKLNGIIVYLEMRTSFFRGKLFVFSQEICLWILAKPPWNFLKQIKDNYNLTINLG